MPGKSGLDFIKENKKDRNTYYIITAKGEAYDELKVWSLVQMIIYQNLLSLKN